MPERCSLKNRLPLRVGLSWRVMFCWKCVFFFLLLSSVRFLQRHMISAILWRWPVPFATCCYRSNSEDLKWTKMSKLPRMSSMTSGAFDSLCLRYFPTRGSTHPTLFFVTISTLPLLMYDIHATIALHISFSSYRHLAALLFIFWFPTIILVGRRRLCLTAISCDPILSCCHVIAPLSS